MLFAVLIFILIIIAGAFATFMPQNIAETLIYSSWWFIALLILLAFSTLWCVIKRIAKNKKRSLCTMTIMSSLMFHAGICIIAAGAFCTVLFEKTGSVELLTDAAAHTMISVAGKETELPFSITLTQFDANIQTATNKYIVVSHTSNNFKAAYIVPEGSTDFEIVLGSKKYTISEVAILDNAISFKIDNSKSVLQHGIIANTVVNGYVFLYVVQESSEVVSYASNLILQSAKKTKTLTIDIHNSAYFNGYTIYQNSYISAENGFISVIHVQKDWGKYISLVGTLFLCIGLFARCYTLFFNKGTQ